MRFGRKATVALISGFLVSGAVVPAWSASSASERPTATQVASASAVLQPASGVLAAPEFPRFQQIRPEAHNNCQPGHTYSAHDIVGDPDACIMGSVSGLDGVHSTVVAVPAL